MNNIGNVPLRDITFGIIGCGGIGQLHAKVISEAEGAELVAVSDPTEQRAKFLAEKYHADWYTENQQLLARKDIDVVCICTPSGTHADIGIQAARAGKHVLVEKPMDVTLQKADRLLAACREANVKLGVIFQLRFFEASKQVKSAIERGRLGKLVLGDCYMKFYRTQAYYDQASWRGTWELDGGGAMMNQGVHGVDLLQWLMGPVKSVCAYTDILAHRNIEVEDVVVGVLRFENGALGVIEGTTAVYPETQQRLEIHGTNGTIMLEGTELTWIKRWNLMESSSEAVPETKDREILTGPEAVAALGGTGHRLQVEDMANAVRENREPLVNGEEGRKSLEIVLALYQSAREKREIALSHSVMAT